MQKINQKSVENRETKSSKKILSSFKTAEELDEENDIRHLEWAKHNLPKGNINLIPKEGIVYENGYATFK